MEVLENFLLKKEQTVMGTIVKTYNFNETIPEESCVEIVTSIASVCYKSEDKSIGSQKLFNMLMKEGAGSLPSSALEFVPINILIDAVDDIVANIFEEYQELPAIAKYGYHVNGIWVTNMRALYSDHKNEYITKELHDKAMRTRVTYSMPIYKIENVSLYTVGQMVRHREASYQILSRRYSSDAKAPIQFFRHPNFDNGRQSMIFENIEEMSKEYYTELVQDFGVKKEVARGVLPQFTATELWFKLTIPKSRQNFLELRMSKKSQEEIRTIAELL